MESSGKSRIGVVDYPDLFGVPEDQLLIIDPYPNSQTNRDDLLLRNVNDFINPYSDKDQLENRIIDLASLKEYTHAERSYDYKTLNQIEYNALSFDAITTKLTNQLQNIIQSPVKQAVSQQSLLPQFSNLAILNNSNYYDLEATRPEELAEMTLPILDFIEDMQPHVVIGCDRGGRLFSLAIHAAWRQTRGGQPFPTLDGALHFARISKTEDPAVLQEKIDAIIAKSKQFGEQRGNTVADGEQLRVLFVDDWVIGGGTMRLAQNLVKKYGAETRFAVMCGGGADVTGNPELHTTVSWHDDPEEIGVNYLSTVQQNEDGSISQRQQVIAVRGAEAMRNRRRIQQAVKILQDTQVLQRTA